MDGLKLTLKQHNTQQTCFSVGDITIGRDFTLIAGPCSIESEKQALSTAFMVKEAGANIFRGGAFKPRTSPYSFQGLGEQALKILNLVRQETGLPVVTEIMDPRHVGLVAEFADILQIGTRNMQNFPLLREAGQTGKPILLKRGVYATLQEWLSSAEYILSEGDPHVILCERGIRTFEPYTRNTLDLSAIPALKEITHLPVIVDPSHGTGRASLVPPMSLAAVAAGSDGLIMEVHYKPEEAASDKDQALSPALFRQSARDILDLYRYLHIPKKGP
jgi:3-deoxy-7-phosphoheptulonate synthase